MLLNVNYYAVYEVIIYVLKQKWNFYFQKYDILVILSILMRISHDFGRFFATRIRTVQDPDPHHWVNGKLFSSTIRLSQTTIYHQYRQISREKKTTFKTLGYKIYRKPLYRNKPDCLLEVSKEKGKKICCIVYTVHQLKCRWIHCPNT